MKLIEKTETGYLFGTDSGCTWTREKLVWAQKSVEIRGWEATRNLYLPTESDLEFFPDALYLIELTPDRCQEDSLFTTVPCRMKPGTKSVLQLIDHDNTTYAEVRIRNLFDWRA